MRQIALGLALATGFGIVACSAQPYGQYGPTAPGGPGVSVGFNVFYDALSPYGSWVDLDPWGQVWVPSSVPADWRPYTDGHWVYTNDGWTWVSDFGWGWAPFHYGRWYFDPVYGWLWIPGDVWGPAWVAWRWGGGFVGWAPLPPGVGWELGFGFTTADFDVLIPQHNWIFCNDHDFDRPHLGGFLVPERDDSRHFDRTRDVTDYATVNDRVVNRSIGTERIARATGRSVPRFELRELEHPGRTQERGHEHALELYRPRFIARGEEQMGERRPSEQHGFEQGRERRSAPSRGEMRSFNELQRRQQEEAQQLRQRQETERRQMEERQRQGAASPGQHRPNEAQQRNETERRQLEQRQMQERRQMQQRFAQERRQAESGHQASHPQGGEHGHGNGRPH